MGDKIHRFLFSFFYFWKRDNKNKCNITLKYFKKNHINNAYRFMLPKDMNSFIIKKYKNKSLINKLHE